MCPAVSAGMKRHLALASASPRQSPTPQLEVRRAWRGDLERVTTLEWEEKWVQEVYGFNKVAEQLEHAMLCLVAEDADGDLQGYAVFNNYPDETLTPRASWRQWLLHAAPLLDSRQLSPVTCLFQTQLVCSRTAVGPVLRALLTWLFSTLPDLERVFHATRCKHDQLSFLEDVGFRFISDSTGSIMEMERSSVVPRLSTRLARLEDHDDLRPMFSRDEGALKERYGDYFLAEVIADKCNSSLSIVLEVNKQAVGIMSVTTQVDFDLLNENFELAPFHGLRKPCKEDVTGVVSRLTRQVLGIRPSSRRTVAEAVEEMEEDNGVEPETATSKMESAECSSADSQAEDRREPKNAQKAVWVSFQEGAAKASKTGSKSVVSKADAKGSGFSANNETIYSKGDRKMGVAKESSKKNVPNTSGDGATPTSESKSEFSKPEEKANTSETGSKIPESTGSKSNNTPGASSGSIKPNDPKSDGNVSTSRADAKSNTALPDAKVDSFHTSNTSGALRDQNSAIVGSSDGTEVETSDQVVVMTASAEIEQREPPLLEQLWGPAVLEDNFGEVVEEEEPIPDDTVPDGSRPVLEMIWGFPVSASGRVSRQVSSTVRGLCSEPATGPPPQLRAVPRYRGAANAAAVNLFCVSDEHACRTLDLLPAVLARLPQLDYLLLTVPADEPESPLTELFTRVPHRSRSTFPGQLFVFHRASLITELEVASAQSCELGDVRALVKHMEGAESVMLAVRELFMDNSAEKSVFVVRCRGQVVGLVVVRPEADVQYVRSHFELEEYVTYELHSPRDGYGHLYHLALNPIFQRFMPVVLAEVMRLTIFSVLLYAVVPAGADDADQHTLTAALQRLWPVTWRRQIQYPLAQLGANIPKPAILQVRDWVALQLVTRAAVLRHRRRVTIRVVVVGGGDTGTAVLERLVFSRELLFVNVTLVEPHGFRGNATSATLAADMRTSTENFQKDRLATMWLPTWVNLVRGQMTSIDRKRKCIHVLDVGEVPYDYLLLACGQQFQLPRRLVPRPPRPFADRRPLFLPAQLPDAPENVFRVNSQFDAERALEYVRAYCLDRTENVVIYGRFLETLTCLETLIQLPVPRHRLVLVLPPDVNGERTKLTDDAQVNSSIFYNLRSPENGIRILESYILTYWDAKSNNRIYRIQLTNSSVENGPSERYLSCCGLFVYDHKAVELATFKAINDASLVFDGRLVIDHQFGTNDANIRAVGTMTKYSRRYHADNFDHLQYNSREVGHALGDQLLQMCGDTHQVFTTKLSTKDRRRSSISGQPLTPEFSQPLVTRARLPDGWCYLEVVAPQPVIDLEPPWVLTTGDPVYRSATGYMRIEVNRWRVLQKITCYSQNTIETGNMLALFGLHEVLLNNLVARYQAGLVPDLYEYLRQPWAMMLFHDRFSVLLNDIRQAMLRCRCRDAKLTLEEKIVDNLCRYNELTETEHIKILEDFRTRGIDKMVETSILQYLANNHYHLPMYAREGTAEALKVNKDSVLDSAAAGITVSRGHIARGADATDTRLQTEQAAG